MTLLVLVFAMGYLAIIAEHPLGINKTAFALMTGALCWTVLATDPEHGHYAPDELAHHVGGIAEILLFLMGAMTIVELIDLHDGFAIITNRIRARSFSGLLWLISGITFFLSAVLDNLTTAIVMVSVLRKLVPDAADRRFFAGMVIIAANAGGAFSPIGDVTTTMLWMNGQLSTFSMIKSLFLPSLVSLLVPLLVVSFQLRGKQLPERSGAVEGVHVKGAKGVLLLGLLVLLYVPVFKTQTHLPPYMGILLGLGVLWMIVEVIHRQDEKLKTHSAAAALSRIDVPSVLFFFGILAAVAALESAGILRSLAIEMDQAFGNKDLIIGLIGLASAVVDNVPLVAAAMGMYSLNDFPMDSKLWEFLAYAAGTGGSILIIGSAAGVAVMGIEKIDFIWYLRRISLLALIGYIAGALTYLATWEVF